MKNNQMLMLAALGLLACHADTSDTATAAASQLATGPATARTMPAGLSYPWRAQPGPAVQTLAARFAPPAGCRRVAVAAGSWGEWLRWLPLQPAGTPARLYNGQLKNRQEVVAAVVDIDVGSQDLQQCADAVIRLRAEYLFSQDPNKVHFHLTTGYDFWFSDFVAGKTFKVRGEEVTPATRPAEAPTHAALGRYLIPTFGYAGTLSLSRELRPVPLAGRCSPATCSSTVARPATPCWWWMWPKTPPRIRNTCCWPRATCRPRAFTCYIRTGIPVPGSRWMATRQRLIRRNGRLNPGSWRGSE